MSDDVLGAEPPRGLDRGGHLSELALDRLRSDGPLARTEFHRNAEAHLASCARCQAAQRALEAMDAELAIAPPVVAEVIPLASRARPSVVSSGRTRWLAAAVSLAVAAVVLVVVAPWRAGVAPERPSAGEPGPGGLDPDHVTLKSGALDFEVHVHDGQQSHPAPTGSAVRPGDRVSFRVDARARGYLLVVGSDELGHAYLCWPQDVVVAAETTSAPAFGPTSGPEQLASAMRFDDAPGAEHLVAVFCPEPFAYADVATRELLGAGDGLLGAFRQAHAGCTIRAVVLHKASGVGP